MEDRAFQSQHRCGVDASFGHLGQGCYFSNLGRGLWIYVWGCEGREGRWFYLQEQTQRHTPRAGWLEARGCRRGEAGSPGCRDGWKLSAACWASSLPGCYGSESCQPLGSQVCLFLVTFR